MCPIFHFNFEQKMDILRRLRWIIFLTSVIFNYANGSKLVAISGKPLSCGSSVSVGADDVFLISDVMSANTHHAQKLTKPQLFQSRLTHPRKTSNTTNKLKPQMSKVGQPGPPIDEMDDSERFLAEMKLKEPLKKDIVIPQKEEKPEEVTENGFDEHIRTTGPFQEERKKYVPSSKRIKVHEEDWKKTKEESETAKLLHEPGLLAALRREDFRHPFIQNVERNPKENVPNASKIPGYIQHMLNKMNGKSTSDPSNVKTPVNQEENAEKREEDPNSSGPGSSNTQDILESLKPEMLDQLRQILNAAAEHNSKGSFNPSPGDDKEKSFAPRRRLKRAILWPQYPIEKLAEEDGVAGRQSGRSHFLGPRKCFWQFSRANKKCSKLVARVMYWVDSRRDCKLEKLSISGRNNTEKLCGQNNNARSFSFQGDNLVIEHFRTSGLSTVPAKFKVTVFCE